MKQNRIESTFLNRRDFLTVAGGAAAALFARPLLTIAGEEKRDTASLRFGVIADLHHGYAPDALVRLQAFMAEMKLAKPDFIIELGDFCNRPDQGKGAEEVQACWDQFSGPRYHVVGNHDTDALPKEKLLAAWGMKSAYYSFDSGPFHFVVLDCNYIRKNGKIIAWQRGNPYGNLLPPEQLEWLRKDLVATDKQTVIFSHQGFDDRGTINRQEVRRVIAAANAQAGFAKVVACFCGHYHLDDATVFDGVHYLAINSASYYYVGGRFGDDGSARAAYRDPLFALVTLDPAGTLTVAGRKSEFRHPTPSEKKFPGAERLTASISDRKLAFPAKK